MINLVGGDVQKVHLPRESFHAVLTDPPYELGFMGEKWDNTGIAFSVSFWQQIKDAMLPGALGMSFSSSLKGHRVACAIEDAGFIIEPPIAWMTSQAIGLGRSVKLPGFDGRKTGRQALKSAFEPIIVFRKPHTGTLESAAATYGTSTMWVDGIRFLDDSGVSRLPPNVILDARIAEMLHTIHGRPVGQFYPVVEWHDIVYERVLAAPPQIYHPKASRRERDAGLESMPLVDAGVLSARRDGSLDGHIPKGRNDHTTIKPLGLTRMLAQLLLPPDVVTGRKILIPFSGAGSEVIGAGLAGWPEIFGVEINPHYNEIAELRIKHWLGHEFKLTTGEQDEQREERSEASEAVLPGLDSEDLQGEG